MAAVEDVNYMKKIIISLIIYASLFASVAQAGFLNGNAVNSINQNTGALQNSAGYDPGTTVGNVVAAFIKGFLGLLGVIFVILIVVAGFNWMTAGGDEEKIKKATQTISRAVIGLIIIVAAYAITYFVFANLPTSSGQYGGG